MSTPPEQRRSDRARLLMAAALLVGLLAAGGVALALSGGSEEREFATAPQRCVEGWNGDDAALVLGRHQFETHRYQHVQVLHLDSQAIEVPPTDPGAECAIIFAAAALDPEAASAVQVLKPIGWGPISRSAGPQRLGDLQAGAQSSYNAILQPDGTVEAL